MATLAISELAVSSVPARTARWQVLVGAVLVQLILGTVYGYSIFWQPLEAALWPPVVTSAEVAAAQAEGRGIPTGAIIATGAAEAAREREKRHGYLKYAFAICLLSFATAMVFAGRFQDQHGPRVTALVGGIVLGTAPRAWASTSAANFAMFPSLTADLFGARNFGANYGWVFTSYGVAGVAGIWAGNLAQGLTGSYFAAFALAAGLCFVSAMLAIVLARSIRRACHA